MKVRTKILATILLVGAVVTSYDLYLSQIRAKTTCGTGNSYICADEIEALRLAHLATQNQIAVDKQGCVVEGAGFCQKAVDGYLIQIENIKRLSMLRNSLDCGIRTPLMVFYEHCLAPTFPDETDQLRSKIETNLSKACEGGVAREASCENALKFNEKHPEFKVDRARLLTEACNQHVSSACEAGLREALGPALTEAAARDFVLRFSREQPGPLENLSSECKTDPRLYEISHKKVQQFDVEVTKPQDDKFALSNLAREAYILNCRDSQARLRLAVAQAGLGDVRGSRKLLAKVDHGQAEYSDNVRLEPLRAECLRVRDASDPWCLQFLKTKYGYKSPAEVKNLIGARVNELKKLVLGKKIALLSKAFHPQKGLELADFAEEGEAAPSKYLKPQDPKKQGELKKLLAKATPFFKKGKLSYDVALAKGNTESLLVADFNVYGGHHAGNYSGLRLEFQQVKRVWYLTRLSFPEDSTP